jgi:hypothetical protein
MTDKRPKRPRDPAQLAKLIVDIATGQVADHTEEKSDRGRAGGLKGGAARANALDPQTRQEIARKAAISRWGKRRP